MVNKISINRYITNSSYFGNNIHKDMCRGVKNKYIEDLLYTHQITMDTLWHNNNRISKKYQKIQSTNIFQPRINNIPEGFGKGNVSS